jgi:tetratricopeptide (TPR) repeat protein
MARGVGPALLIFCVAAVVRLVHVFQIRRAPFFTMLMGDARGYDTWAQRIAGGEWIGGEVFYQAPLYPYFLGAVYTFAGRDLLAVRLVQALLGASACALLGLAAMRLFPKPAGLIAGLALALYAPAVFFDGLIQKSVLDVFLVCLAIWLVSLIVQPSASSTSVATPRFGVSRLWLALGLTMGALALTRENAFVLVVVIVIWSLTRTGSEGRSPGLRLRAHDTATFLVGLAIVLAPVAIRNYAVGGGFYLTTSQFGSNFYIGNNPKADGTYMSLRFGRGAPEYERQDATELAEHALGRRLTPAEVSSYWTNRAIGFITSQPAAWLGLLGRKFQLLWNADEMLDTESQEAHAEWSTVLRLGAWIGHFGVLAPLALLGAWLAWPDRRRLWVLYAMTLAYAASVLVFYVFARYRFPLVPFLILFAAAAVAKMWEIFTQAPAAMPTLRQAQGRSEPRRGTSREARYQRSTRWGWGWGPSASGIMLVFVAAIVFTNWPVLSKPLMLAITENNLAVAFQEDGQIDLALAHYQRSLKHRPDYAPAHNNMGAALRAAGRTDEAVASYRRALESQPDYPDAHYNLANALLEQKRPEEAAAHFRVALAAIPDSAGSHNNLGIALAAEGKLEESVAEFRAALKADPDSPKANRNIGKALSELGRSAEAIGYLRRAVALAPMDKEAHYDLGSDLLALNQMAEAASEFQAALALDPQWVAAHNNLGIALASLDRLDDAITHFRRALEIQPDYPDAKRNLALALDQRKR